jgi:hypothetical protein
MVRRVISAVASMGMSFGLIAWTVLAANAIEPQSDNSAPSQISEPNAMGRADAAQYEGVRLSWDITKGRSSGRSGSGHMRFRAVFEPTATESGRQRVATRHRASEWRSAPRMALVLGVAY